ncbi:asr4535 [Nostoc sp. PCC 7120 = FACHB-418]|nr:asr4535 [Nostoc sp. PCC 7120 = FACHB-418]
MKNQNMAIFRQYIAPLLVVLVFIFALVAVSARIFLPSDMAAPAPIEEVGVSFVPISDFPIVL